jgi:hypothetical protein
LTREASGRRDVVAGQNNLRLTGLEASESEG